MLKIYGIKNCSTMKKAFAALEHQELNYEFHDYKKQSIDIEKIEQWLELVSRDILLNKKGTTWKKLTPEQQSYALSSQKQLIETLIANPSMIKRPVLEVGSKLIVGFDEAAYQALSK